MAQRGSSSPLASGQRAQQRGAAECTGSEGSSRSSSSASWRSPRSSLGAGTGAARIHPGRPTDTWLFRPARKPSSSRRRPPTGTTGSRTRPGAFNPAWVRSAARQDARMASRVPAGSDGPHGDELDIPRPEARAHDGLHRLLRLRQHRGPDQRDRRRPDHDDERLDRRLRGERRRRRLEDDQLLQQLARRGPSRPTIR